MPYGSGRFDFSRRCTMSTPEARKLAAVTQTLRRSRVDAPALDVLDLVMKDRRRQLPDFGDLALPPAPFALTVAEAFDRGMSVDDWALMTGSLADPTLRTAVLGIFASEVWPRFVQRYGLA